MLLLVFNGKEGPFRFASPSPHSVTVTDVPPGFPLQTHLCFLGFFFFSLLLLFWFPSKQTHVFVFLPVVFGWSLQRLCQSFICPPPPASAPSVPYSHVNYFDEIFFGSLFISTWLLNLLSCCLYIILILSYDFLSFIFIIL